MAEDDVKKLNDVVNKVTVTLETLAKAFDKAPDQVEAYLKEKYSKVEVEHQDARAFKDEIGSIKNEFLKGFTTKFFNEMAPKYFYNVEAATKTGNHPGFAVDSPAGLVKHSQALVDTIKVFSTLNPGALSQLEKDMAIVSALIHDAAKRGLPDKYGKVASSSVADHAMLVKDLIPEEYFKSLTAAQQALLQEVIKADETHMKQYNTQYHGGPLVPGARMPETKIEQIVGNADGAAAWGEKKATDPKSIAKGLPGKVFDPRNDPVEAFNTAMQVYNHYIGNLSMEAGKEIDLPKRTFNTVVGESKLTMDPARVLGAYDGPSLSGSDLSGVVDILKSKGVYLSSSSNNLVGFGDDLRAYKEMIPYLDESIQREARQGRKPKVKSEEVDQLNEVVGMTSGLTDDFLVTLKAQGEEMGVAKQHMDYVILQLKELRTKAEATRDIINGKSVDLPKGMSSDPNEDELAVYERIRGRSADDWKRAGLEAGIVDKETHDYYKSNPGVNDKADQLLREMDAWRNIQGGVKSGTIGLRGEDGTILNERAQSDLERAIALAQGKSDLPLDFYDGPNSKLPDNFYDGLASPYNAPARYLEKQAEIRNTPTVKKAREQYPEVNDDLNKLATNLRALGFDTTSGGQMPKTPDALIRPITKYANILEGDNEQAKRSKGNISEFIDNLYPTPDTEVYKNLQKSMPDLVDTLGDENISKIKKLAIDAGFTDSQLLELGQELERLAKSVGKSVDVVSKFNVQTSATKLVDSLQTSVDRPDVPNNVLPLVQYMSNKGLKMELPGAFGGKSLPTGFDDIYDLIETRSEQSRSTDPSISGPAKNQATKFLQEFDRDSLLQIAKLIDNDQSKLDKLMLSLRNLGKSSGMNEPLVDYFLTTPVTDKQQRGNILERHKNKPDWIGTVDYIPEVFQKQPGFSLPTGISDERAPYIDILGKIEKMGVDVSDVDHTEESVQKFLNKLAKQLHELEYSFHESANDVTARVLRAYGSLDEVEASIKRINEVRRSTGTKQMSLKPLQGVKSRVDAISESSYGSGVKESYLELQDRKDRDKRVDPTNKAVAELKMEAAEIMSVVKTHLQEQERLVKESILDLQKAGQFSLISPETIGKDKFDKLVQDQLKHVENQRELSEKLLNQRLENESRLHEQKLNLIKDQGVEERNRINKEAFLAEADAQHKLALAEKERLKNEGKYPGRIGGGGSGGNGPQPPRVADIRPTARTLEDLGVQVGPIAKFLESVRGGKASTAFNNAIENVIGYGSIGGLGSVLKAGYDSIRDYELALKNLERVYDEFNPAKKASEMRTMGLEMRRVAIEFGETVENVGRIQEEWVKTGSLSGKDISGLTRVSLLAKNTSDLSRDKDEGDTENAAKSVTYINSAMQQLSMTEGDVADNALRILDSWNKMADDFPGDTRDFADSFQRSASFAHNLGLKLDDLNAIVAILLKRTGRDGREIGNALQTMFSNMTRPKAIETLRKYGVEIEAGAGEFRSFIPVIQELSDKYKQLGEAQKNAFQVEIADALGQTRRKNYVMALMEGLDEYDLARNKSAFDSAGYSETKNAITMSSMAKQTQQLKAAFQDLSVAIGDTGLVSFLKLTTQGLTNLTSGLSQLSPLTRDLIGTWAIFGTSLTALNKTAQVFSGKTLVQWLTQSRVSSATTKQFSDVVSFLNGEVIKGTISAQEAAMIHSNLAKTFGKEALSVELSSTALEVQSVVLDRVKNSTAEIVAGTYSYEMALAEANALARSKNLTDAETVEIQLALGVAMGKTTKNIQLSTDAMAVQTAQASKLNKSMAGYWLAAGGTILGVVLTVATLIQVFGGADARLQESLSEITSKTKELADAQNLLDKQRSMESVINERKRVIKTLEAQKKQISEIDSTSREYFETQDKLSIETEKLESEQSDLLGVQKELASLIPEATTAFNKQNEAIAENAKNSERLLKIKKEELWNEKQKSVLEALDKGKDVGTQSDEYEKRYSKLAKDYSKLMANITDWKEQGIVPEDATPPIWAKWDWSKDAVDSMRTFLLSDSLKEEMPTMSFESLSARMIKQMMGVSDQKVSGMEMYKEAAPEIQKEAKIFAFQTAVNVAQSIRDEMEDVNKKYEEAFGLKLIYDNYVKGLTEDEDLIAAVEKVKQEYAAKLQSVQTDSEGRLGIVQSRIQVLTDANKKLQTMEKYQNKPDNRKYVQAKRDLEDLYAGLSKTGAGTVANVRAFLEEENKAIENALAEDKDLIHKQINDYTWLLGQLQIALEKIRKTYITANPLNEAIGGMAKFTASVQIPKEDAKRAAELDAKIEGTRSVLEALQELSIKSSQAADEYDTNNPWTDRIPEQPAGTGDKYEALDKRLKALDGSLDSVKTKLQILDTIWKNADQTLEYFSRKQQILKEDLMATGVAIDILTREIKKLNSADDSEKREELLKKRRDLIISTLDIRSQLDEINKQAFDAKELPLKDKLQRLQKEAEILQNRMGNALKTPDYYVSTLNNYRDQAKTTYQMIQDQMVEINRIQKLIVADEAAVTAARKLSGASGKEATDKAVASLRTHNKQLREARDLLADLRSSYLGINNQMTDLVANALKVSRQKDLEAETSAIDKLIKKENERYESWKRNHDEKVKALEREYAEDTYNIEQDRDQEKIDDLQSKYDSLEEDNSQWAVRKRKEYQDQIDQLNQQMGDRERQRNNELERQKLDDEAESEEESHDNLIEHYEDNKTATEEYYEDLLEEAKIYSDALVLINSGAHDQILELLNNAYLPRYKDTMEKLAMVIRDSMGSALTSVIAAPELIAEYNSNKILWQQAMNNGDLELAKKIHDRNDAIRKELGLSKDTGMITWTSTPEAYENKINGNPQTLESLESPSDSSSQPDPKKDPKSHKYYDMTTTDFNQLKYLSSQWWTGKEAGNTGLMSWAATEGAKIRARYPKLPDGFIPSYRGGGIQERDGFAYLHKKEMILPEKISRSISYMTEIIVPKLRHSLPAVGFKLPELAKVTDQHSEMTIDKLTNIEHAYFGHDIDAESMSVVQANILKRELRKSGVRING